VNKPINLADLSNSPYLASDDFPVGMVLPAVQIERIVMEEVPVPNSRKTNLKAIAYFKGATKGWCMNKTVARAIAKAANLQTKDIGTAWIGVTIRLVVVGDVKRPDGTKGNAFRLSEAWAPGQAPKAGSAAAPTAGQAEPPAEATPANGAAT
jgi:hypothetical protein